MYEYKINELKVWNEFCKSRRLYKGFEEQFTYSIENELSIDEKIDFMNCRDLFTKGKELFAKWNNEKRSLIKRGEDWVDHRVFNKWLKKNKGDLDFTESSIKVFGVNITFDMSAELTENPFESKSKINKIFHNFVVTQLLPKERDYYLTEDRKALKFVKLRKLIDKYRLFTPLMVYDFGYNLDYTDIKDIDEGVIDELLEKFEEFEKIVAKFDQDFIDIAKAIKWRESL